MTPAEIRTVLEDVRNRLERGENVDLREAGFWRAVAAVKRSPELVDDFAAEIAAIDRTAFERWAMLSVPIGIGTVLMLAASVAGLVLVSLGYFIDDPWNGLSMLVGFGILEVTTHGLAHLLVGVAVGIGFTHWFIGTPTRPQPGVKIDYATYLRATPRGRAWMHAAGAIATKAVPFLVLGSALVAGVPWWTTAILLVVGIVQIVTDVTLSVKSGDWKKFRREMRYAREG